MTYQLYSFIKCKLLVDQKNENFFLIDFQMKRTDVEHFNGYFNS